MDRVFIFNFHEDSLLLLFGIKPRSKLVTLRVGCGNSNFYKVLVSATVKINVSYVDVLTGWIEQGESSVSFVRKIRPLITNAIINHRPDCSST